MLKARLVTQRQLERPVVIFAPTEKEALGNAERWLQASGESGDQFDIVEQREVVVRSVVMTGRDEKGFIITAEAS